MTASSSSVAQAGTTAASHPPPEADTVYRELCADFRSLNGFLWQTPVLFTTLTGGLWFAVASLQLTEDARTWLLVFAGLANLIMIVALYRLRFVMQRIQDQIRERDGRRVIGPNYVIVTCFALLLLVSAVGSLWAASCPALIFSPGTASRR